MVGGRRPVPWRPESARNSRLATVAEGMDARSGRFTGGSARHSLPRYTVRVSTPQPASGKRGRGQRVNISLASIFAKTRQIRIAVLRLLFR